MSRLLAAIVIVVGLTAGGMFVASQMSDAWQHAAQERTSQVRIEQLQETERTRIRETQETARVQIRESHATQRFALSHEFSMTVLLLMAMAFSLAGALVYLDRRDGRLQGRQHPPSHALMLPSNHPLLPMGFEPMETDDRDYVTVEQRRE